MALIDKPHEEYRLWRAALDSALGPLSVYLTPETYGLSTINVGAADNEPDEFSSEIAKRLDLARALAALELVNQIGGELPRTYRHSVHYCDDRIDGALLVPRLVRERAAGRTSRIPVLRAARFDETPEALLVSESIRVSLRVLANWVDKGGAEGLLASRASNSFAIVEARQPWASLKLRPRPVLRSIASTVKSRTVAGWNAKGGALDKLSDLMLTGAGAVSSAAGPIAFVLSQDRRFEDRLFELICLGWLIRGLRRWDPSGQVFPKSISGKGPVFDGRRNAVSVQLHYQAGYLGAAARYRTIRGGKPLRAIPDFSLEIKTEVARATYILDAKNRVLSADSEIIYKLLGYQENLGLDPYLGLGIAPADNGRYGTLRGVRYGERNAAVLRLPLSRGAAIVERAVGMWLDGIGRGPLGAQPAANS